MGTVRQARPERSLSMTRKVVLAFLGLATAALLTAPAALAQQAPDSQQYGDDIYGGTDTGAVQQPAGSTGDSATLAKKTAPATTKLHANLTGEAEVPPGDAQASGTADVKVSGGQVCWDVRWTGFAATASHIHKAVKGKAGPIVVPFFKAEQGAVSGQRKQGCTEVSAELAKGIAEHPANYYVNVHDVEFPKGAIRGQLASAGAADVGAQLPNTGSFRSRGLLLLSLSIVAAGSLLLAVGQRRRRPSHVRR
jgi:LPXTG-motif cell wall-anchored protein